MDVFGAQALSHFLYSSTEARPLRDTKPSRPPQVVCQDTKAANVGQSPGILGLP